MSPPQLGKLTESEKKLHQSVLDGNYEEASTLLSQPDVQVDCLDDHGMTPLQQAAYKGNSQLVKLLLNRGGDVNSSYHEHGYTALMFAALSGNTEVTQLLLEAGACVDRQNSVGRNAAQMAAFVGQRQCVSVINNFFSRKDLEYYCRPQGLETEAKLPEELCTPLYELIACHNLSPVKMSMVLQDHDQLFSETYKVARVLDLLCEKMMKQSNTNEVMGMKFHYLATTVRHCEKWQTDKGDKLEGWIKSLVRGRESDGCREAEEKFIRATIKSFPFVENMLLQQMVRTLAPVPIGGPPTALSVLSSGINGQRFGSEDDRLCGTCEEPQAEKKCSACKAVNYCNPRCQKLDWSMHKRFCKEMGEERLRREALKKAEEEAEARRKAEELERAKSAEEEEQAKSAEEEQEQAKSAEEEEQAKSAEEGQEQAKSTEEGQIKGDTETENKQILDESQVTVNGENSKTESTSEAAAREA